MASLNAAALSIIAGMICYTKSLPVAAPVNDMQYYSAASNELP